MSVPPSPLRFDTVYREHFAFVWRTARYLGVPRGELEDVAQDVFLTVQRKLSDYDGRVSVKSWLYGFVRRVVADHRRRYRRKESKLRAAPEEQGLDAYETADPTPLATLESSEALVRLDRVLALLTPEKRETFLLAELEELTAAEIGVVMSANVNTVYTRLRAAREEVSAAYTKMYGPDSPGGRDE
jgi:RNA polymerase sigma-70 factor (ECF subfamily)